MASAASNPIVHFTDITTPNTEDAPPQEECQEGNPVLPDGEGVVWSAASAMHGHGGQHPGDGWARLAGAGLLYTEPQTEDPCRSDIKPPRASTARIADASVRKVHLAPHGVDVEPLAAAAAAAASHRLCAWTP